MDKGLVYFSDLLDKRGSLVNYNELCAKYGIILNWFEYQQLIGAILKIWWHLANNDVCEDQMYQLTLDRFVGKSNSSKIVYNFLIDKNAVENILSYYISFQHKVDDTFSLKDFCSLFRALYCITKDTKLRDFQYRQLLHKIYCNDTLFKWKICRSEKCDYCKEKQTLNRFFM